MEADTVIVTFVTDGGRSPSSEESGFLLVYSEYEPVAGE